jgi:hypothetical protein
VYRTITAQTAATHGAEAGGFKGSFFGNGVRDHVSSTVFIIITKSPAIFPYITINSGRLVLIARFKQVYA